MMMSTRLYVFMFVLKITAGYSLNDNLKYWDVSFAEKLEGFLSGNNHNISGPCKDHLLLFAEDLKLKKEWAMEMFDAGAKRPPPGMLKGNLVDLGNFDECFNIQHRINGSQVLGKYCIGNTLINSKKFQTLSTLFSANSLHTIATTNGTISIYLARCFPHTCSTTEMQKVYTAIDFELTFSDNLCQTKAAQPKLHFGTYITIFFFGVIASVVIFSTIFDIISRLLSTGRPHQMIMAFSAYTNGRKILKIIKNSNDISCVYGIRVLSTMWLVWFHGYFMLRKFPIRNFFYYHDWFKDEKNMLLHSTPLAVDTFLLLSGLFVAYNYMINTLNGVKFNIGLHYIQRYLRLTPVIAVLVLATTTLGIHFGSGPFWQDQMEYYKLECETSWLRALFHLQNIYKPMCLPHSWYLSTDTQLYILSPFLLMSLNKWSKQTFFGIGLLASCSMIASFVMGWIYELNAVEVANQLDKYEEMFWNYYCPVYTRATPWLIGLVLGYILARFKQKAIHFFKCKVTVAVLWMFAVMVLLQCVFLGHFLIINEPNRFLSSLHLALVRPLWAVAMSWVIFACAIGYGGILNYFLSLPVFQVLSKLTFSMYIVHPVILAFSIFQIREPPLFDTFDMFLKFWGVLVLTLIASVVLSVSIEMPVLETYKYLVSRKQKKE